MVTMVTVDKRALVAAPKSVGGLVRKRGGAASLADVKFDAAGGRLAIRATDYESAATVYMDAETPAPFSAVVPHERLLAAVRGSAGATVDLESAADNKLTVRSAGSCATIFGSAPAEFPELPAAGIPEPATLTARDLREMLAEVSYAADRDKSRYALNGIRMEHDSHPGRDGELRLIACDGKRLAVSTRAAPGTLGKLEEKRTQNYDGSATTKAPDHPILPLVAAGVLADLLALKREDARITLKVVGNRIVVIGERFQFSTLALDGEYPNWPAVVPKECREREVVVEAGAFAEAVSRVGAAADNKIPGVRVDVARGSIRLRTRSAGVGGGEAEAEVPAVYDGPPLGSGFNADFLVDAARAVGGAGADGSGWKRHPIRLCLGANSRQAAAIRNGGSAFAVVMPVTLAGYDRGGSG